MAELRHWADATPERCACVVAETGRSITYAELERRANRLAHLLAAGGLRPGDAIALLMDNDPRFFEIVWAGLRLGLYITPIAKYLQQDEANYIIRDSGAKILFVARAFAQTRRMPPEDGGPAAYVLDAENGDQRDYEKAVSAFPPHSDFGGSPWGRLFLYSSGTTGRPKGIRRPLARDWAAVEESGAWMAPFGLDQSSRYLSPAPLYHAAPLGFTLRTMICGGTVVLMSKFDAVNALAALEAYRITHSQWVPTMFFRLLALPPELRSRFDLAAHRCAIHAAAPCPIEIKDRMIGWWGPILWEYYGGSEGNGVTLLSAEEWLAHKGSVGKPVVGVVHILDAAGRELGPGEVGDVYFDGPAFEYHNDPEKTARSRSKQGWSTLGDVGYLDEGGYLYLTDRRAHTIISGGVNIYPAEVESVLSLHPAVRDVAVFGVPNAEFGEEVKSAVALHDPAEAGPALAGELIAYCRERLSHVKCPRSIDFHAELPRTETGKLMKHLLRAAYWPEPSASTRLPLAFSD